MSSKSGWGVWRPLAAALFVCAAPASAEAVTTPLAPAESAPLALPPSALALPLPDPDVTERLAQTEESAPATASSTTPPSRHVLPNVLKSLALPGWGALSSGHRNVGLGFLVAEAALWTTVGVSVGQGHLRRGSSEETAALYAGIDLEGKDDRFRKLVSNYPSSDEYNRLVVMREAAALYYGDHDRYTAYIDQHSLSGADAWSWESENEWERYRQLRRSSERAFQRARFAAVGALVNRVAAAIVASRLSPRGGPSAVRASSEDGMAVGPLQWNLESAPGSRLELRHRLAWVVPFE